jgi:DNA repair protein RadC
MDCANHALASWGRDDARTPSTPRSVPLFIVNESGLSEAPPDAILASAQALIAARFRRGSSVLDSSELVRQFLHLTLAPRDYEVFGALFLDRKKRLIAFVELFHGTVDHVIVRAREVFREVIAHNAVSVIFVRNDPAGCTDPNPFEWTWCLQMADLLNLIDVAILDYFVVGESITSFAELGVECVQWSAELTSSVGRCGKERSRTTKSATAT